ncbi:hypothetical protein PGTUg99_031645 [Puccinia graminis f. sp. tritici]|uniref:Dynein associated protein domain-containing protein n=1 Tax=Puccinia graminis f. sp. tritici TaxID=56615 RepID=A0A5B0PIU6_PUCGR|nr:hypothetical protein PGTUg99_031645 [Puccinia graminis f. sp. tritici]
MAEERLNQTESLLVSMKDELETLKVELGLLKEIQVRIESGGPEESDQATTLKVIQLEKQNSRLKEALARMGDLSQEAEQASREYSVLLSQLEAAESQVEELKQQSDASMEVEDMLEQLTEQNLTLNEKIEDMKMIIEDLEALKELADELEENHVETEKQIQEEIDFKDIQLREHKKRNEALEESVADYKSTILQFRELVLSLQTDLDAMRERQQIQHDESQSVASQTQAMLNLNQKLQNSSVKGQVKAIDLELCKLESTQAMLQCSIMKREELKEGDVGREIERFLPQMRHLAEIYVSNSDYDVAELQYRDISTLDVDLDSILVCIAFAKQTIAALEQDGQIDPNADLSDIVFCPLQNLLGQARTAKVISKKLLRRLQDLTRQSCSLNPNHSNAITVLKDNTYDLTNVSLSLADLVERYCSELVSSKEIFLLDAYNHILQEATHDIVKHTGRPLKELFTLLSHLALDLGITLGVATDPEHVARSKYILHIHQCLKQIVADSDNRHLASFASLSPMQFTNNAHSSPSPETLSQPRISVQPVPSLRAVATTVPNGKLTIISKHASINDWHSENTNTTHPAVPSQQHHCTLLHLSPVDVQVIDQTPTSADFQSPVNNCMPSPVLPGTVIGGVDPHKDSPHTHILPIPISPFSHSPSDYQPFSQSPRIQVITLTPPTKTHQKITDLLIRARINLQEALSATPQARSTSNSPSDSPVRQYHPQHFTQAYPPKHGDGQSSDEDNNSGLSSIKEDRTAEMAAEHSWRIRHPKTDVDHANPYTQVSTSSHPHTTKSEKSTASTNPDQTQNSINSPPTSHSPTQFLEHDHNPRKHVHATITALDTPYVGHQRAKTNDSLGRPQSINDEHNSLRTISNSALSSEDVVLPSSQPPSSSPDAPPPTQIDP